MSYDEKKLYLQNYAVYIAMSSRIKEMIKSYPSEKARFLPQLNLAMRICECIENEIELVKPRILSEILAQKYLSGKSLDEIATLMNYSKRQIERLHRSAIKMFTPFTIPDIK